MDPSGTYQKERLEFWQEHAEHLDGWHGLGDYYRRRLIEVYGFHIAQGQSVLELGCGQGDLLAALQPETGVGVDFSSEMVRRARERHPQFRFIHADVHELHLEECFDAIILSDLVNDLWDVQNVLKRVHALSHPGTRVILNFYSRLWELPLKAAARLKLAAPMLPQNWLATEDVVGLLELCGFEVIRRTEEVLWRVRTPVLDAFLNRFAVKLWPCRYAALTSVIVARPDPGHSARARDASRRKVSVVVAARNEAGNIEAILERVPQMGTGTELIFVEGGSTDNTYETIQSAIAAHPEKDVKLLKQPGKGKGDAVRHGFDHATGDVLMILDADMTVPPEDLPRFYEAWLSGKGEFVNGVRLVYPMEEQAMRFCNLIGNKFFSLAFSWLLGQPIKDTLCGTKVLSREHYELLAANRSYFGDFDPFGDFDLIFGAAKLNLKIVDLPIRYRARTYGDTNISRWSHGWLLLKMVLFAMWRIKFT